MIRKLAPAITLAIFFHAGVAHAAGERLPSAPGVVASTQTVSNVPNVPGGAPCTGQNLMLDPGLEATDPGSFANPNWTSTSTNFGTGICSEAACGIGGGASPPHAGTFWAWLGGTTSAETTTLSQTVTMPAGGPHWLNFYMRIGTVNTPFNATMEVRVDGNVVQTYPEPSTAEAAYTQRHVDLAAFADGGSHTIEFRYVNPAGSGTSSYTIDDITLECTMPVSLQSFGID